jgi:DNA-binding FrmR family transcriptional regulator
MAKPRSHTLKNDYSALHNRVARLEGRVAALGRMIEGSTEWKKMLVLAAAGKGAAIMIPSTCAEEAPLLGWMGRYSDN